MNILIVSQYFWPENFRINDLSKELVERGHNVTVLTGLPNYPQGHIFPDFNNNPSDYQYYEGVDVIRVPLISRGKSSWRLALNYLSFAIFSCAFGPWLLRKKRIDLVFAYQLSPVTIGLPSILVGRIKRAPVVFWVLDLWPETLSAAGVVKSGWMLRWIGKLVGFIYQRCTLVLGQSQGFLESMANYCSNVEKLRYFPSWAENDFDEENLQLAPEVPIISGTFNIVFAGNVGKAQDFPAIIRAAELLKDYNCIRWIIVGDGSVLSWLHREVSERGLGNNFLILGRFPLERMPSFYAHASALLVTLKKDPVFGMTIPGKVQSYLLAGIPILAMLDGEGARVINEANGGNVSPAGDSNSLAESILMMLMLSPQDRRQLGLNGRAYAQQEFARGLAIDRLEALFQEALDIDKLATSES
ncbi:glycosyltransferase family 4 protein [Candidatus Njordibacter sp. Uisw_039]|uniref:glycosyltransferase family 4 protein n=1 Tax=Candidatus Njordibacter sp. Uisw_039 TaxID=3230972 RepID=UPI003D57ACF9